MGILTNCVGIPAIAALLLLRLLDAVEAAGAALALPTQASVTYTLDSPRYGPPVVHRNGGS